MTKILNGNGDTYINDVYQPKMVGFCKNCGQPIEFCYQCDCWHHKHGSVFDIKHPECLYAEPRKGD